MKFVTADVVMTGDFYRSMGYPNIDRNNGGSLKGMVDALNTVIDLAGPSTKIVPGHGAIVDKAGVGSAVLNSMRQVGGSLGIAMMGAIVAASLHVQPKFRAVPEHPRKNEGRHRRHIPGPGERPGYGNATVRRSRLIGSVGRILLTSGRSLPPNAAGSRG